MEVKSLKVERRPSYDDNYPNMLVGTVEMVGPGGKVEVVLSNQSLSAIFQVIHGDVTSRAKQNAKATDHAMNQAENEQVLLEGVIE